MESLGIPMAFADSAMQLSPVHQSPRRLNPRPFSGCQTQYGFPVRASQRECARAKSFPLIPACSPSNEQRCLQGMSVVRIERLPSERSSKSRSDLEQMMWRMVQNDKEPNKKDVEDEPNKTTDSNHQLWRKRVENIQTTTQIFCSTMFWMMLFFMGSLWDDDNTGRKRRNNRGRRK